MCIPLQMSAVPSLPSGIESYVAYMCTVPVTQEKMVLGGAARNRMLIKGGSSFNALVRALKQDVVTGAAPTTTTNEKLMYEVDKVGACLAPQCSQRHLSFLSSRLILLLPSYIQ